MMPLGRRLCPGCYVAIDQAGPPFCTNCQAMLNHLHRMDAIRRASAAPQDAPAAAADPTGDSVVEAA